MKLFIFIFIFINIIDKNVILKSIDNSKKNLMINTVSNYDWNICK